MKTTIDLPDPLFRRAKATAAERGLSLKALITEAVEKRLAEISAPPSWASVLASLPKVSTKTLHTVSQRVAESDAADLSLEDAPRS